MDIKRTDKGYELDSVQVETGLLAPQQARALLAAAAGQSEKETARTLGVSPGTVNRYRSTIFFKLNTHNITQTINVATKLGILKWLMLVLVVLVESHAALHTARTGERIERPVRTVRMIRTNRREQII